MKYQLISQESLSLQVPYAGTASVTTEHGVDADSCILSIIKIIINPLKDLKDFKVDPGQHKSEQQYLFRALPLLRLEARCRRALQPTSCPTSLAVAPAPFPSPCAAESAILLRTVWPARIPGASKVFQGQQVIRSTW